jgi:hypothetical protein
LPVSTSPATCCADGWPASHVVLAAAVTDHFDGLSDDLARLARQVPLALAGAGATQALADTTDARLLTTDPVTEAQRLLPPGR